jgi:hypothetical protein
MRRKFMSKLIVAVLTFTLTAAATTNSSAYGSGRFGEGHPTKFNCPARSRIERFFVRLSNACSNVVAVAPKPDAQPATPAPKQIVRPSGSYL